MYSFNKKYPKIIRTRFLSVCMLVVLAAQNISFVGFADVDFLTLFFVVIFSRKCKYRSKNAIEYKFFLEKCFLKFGDYISGRNLENTTLCDFRAKIKKFLSISYIGKTRQPQDLPLFLKSIFFKKIEYRP